MEEELEQMLLKAIQELREEIKSLRRAIKPEDEDCYEMISFTKWTPEKRKQALKIFAGEPRKKVIFTGLGGSER